MLGRTWLIGVVVALVVPLSASGQAAGVSAGARVRVTSPADNLNATVGTVGEVRNDSMTVVSNRGSRAVAIANITSLEVSTGRRSRVLRDAGLGLGIGALAGVVLGYATFEECTPAEIFDCMFEPESRGESATFGGIGGGALGLVVGALVGVFDRADRWQPVAMPAKLAVRPVAGGGVSVRLSRAF